MKYAKITSYTANTVTLTPAGGGPVTIGRDLVRGKILLGRQVSIPTRIEEGGIIQP